MPSFIAPGRSPRHRRSDRVSSAGRSVMACSRERRGAEKGVVGGRFNTTPGEYFCLLFLEGEVGSKRSVLRLN